MEIVLWIIAAVIGYLLGSINSAVLLSCLVYRSDIREHGSGNAGTTNMLRTFGKKAALFTFLGDFLKGILAVLIGWLLLRVFSYNAEAGMALAGGTAILGHNWPLYFKFRGGKGVLTSFAVMMFLSPLSTVMALLVFVVIVSLTRYVSLGSIAAAAALPVFVFLFGGGFNPAFILSLLVTLLIVGRHHANIKRLVNGQESKIGTKKKENE